MMRAWKSTAAAILLACALGACGDDGPSSTPDGTEGTTTPTDSADGPTGGPGPDDTGVDSADDTGGGPVPMGDELYREDFEGPDGSAWPTPWQQTGDQITTATLQGGRGRYSGNTMNVGRMALPGFSETDVDVVLTVVYDDFFAQGIGFYARQNGGALQQTSPPGQGYAVYVEGGFQQLFGIWRETNGVEEPLMNASVPQMLLEDGTPYRIRFQCFGEGGQTRLRARIWAEGTSEPGGWLVDILDGTPALQGTAGSFAADVYNYTGTGSVYIDDLVITRLLPQ